MVWLNTLLKVFHTEVFFFFLKQEIRVARLRLAKAKRITGLLFLGMEVIKEESETR